jgi:hypothetical protein
MKALLSILICSAVAVSVCAQTINSTVTVKVNGNRQTEVLIDGATYNTASNASNSTVNIKLVTVPNVTAGQHTLEVRTLNAAKTRWATTTSRTFNVRQGYDLTINVRPNGSVQLNEKKAKIQNSTTAVYPTPMATAAYDDLYTTTRDIRGNTARLNALTDIFRNTSNYFTSSQARQLLLLIPSQSARLQLAKTAYRSITDPANFSLVSGLLTSQAARDELTAYVTTYNNTYNNTTAYNNSSNYNAYGSPMTDANFGTLYNSIANQYYSSTRMSLLRDAFSSTTNRFSSYQARQLVQLGADEASRLELAKASYRTITDPTNFSIMYDILQSQASRNDLAAFVQAGGVSSNNSTTYRTPMTDAAFNSIYSNVQGQWFPGAKFNAIRDAFNNTANLFTSAQASQLIQLLSDEANRLELAKRSYANITDPGNFSVMYNLFTTQSYKDALAAYVNSYSSSSSTTGTPTRTPMTESSYNSLYNSIRGQWLPGAKMNALRNTFANSSYYFTSAQAKQLIALVSDEANRLELAKASYRNITDPTAFSQLYDLLSTQANRDALAEYVRTFQY